MWYEYKIYVLINKIHVLIRVVYCGVGMQVDCCVVADRLTETARLLKNVFSRSTTRMQDVANELQTRML